MAICTDSSIYAILFFNILSLGSMVIVPHASYIGCFLDAFDPTTNTFNAPRVLPDGRHVNNMMTIGTCIKLCTNQEHPSHMQYAGLETGNECWCGTAEARYDQYDQCDDSECMVKRCPGNPSQYCGADFKIAVYNLTLVRCQLPLIPGLATPNPDFISAYNNVSFTCLPGYELRGPDNVQCIFDDTITSTRWSSFLPHCFKLPTRIPATTSDTSAVQSTSSTLQTTSFTTITSNHGNGTSQKSTGEINLSDLLVIIGSAVGACVILLLMICLICLISKRRSKRSTQEETQSHGIPILPTSNGSTTKTQKDPQESSFPVYSQPIRPKSRGKSMINDKSATQEQPKPKTDETYSYADVHFNPVTATASIDAVSNVTQWAENNIYAGAEEPTEHEGWRDNNIYEAS